MQADEYRNAKNDYQLYTMLMRFARYRPCSIRECRRPSAPWAHGQRFSVAARSLVLETIPQHANFGKGGRREYEQERFKEVRAHCRSRRSAGPCVANGRAVHG